MITLFFLILFGTVLMGFCLYHYVFSDDGRKGRAAQTAVGAQEPKTGRVTGLD